MSAGARDREIIGWGPGSALSGEDMKSRFEINIETTWKNGREDRLNQVSDPHRVAQVALRADNVRLALLSS